MKTIAKFLCVIACILTTAGCEDDREYTGPPKHDKYPPEELLVTLKIPFESEFDVAFSRETYYDIESFMGSDFWEIVYWSGVEPGQPIYVLSAYGKGENALIGKFDFQMSTICLTQEICFTFSKITAGKMGTLNIQFKDGLFFLTSDYPYDGMDCERGYLFTGGSGKFEGSDGGGFVKLTDSDSDDYMFRMTWNGTLNLVISR